jgi:hypothetical protein
MASILGPGAEFGDAERQRLIDKLNSLLAGPGEDYILPPSQWAALWLSDLGCLKDLVEAVERTPLFTGFFNNPTMIGESVLKPCMLSPTTIKFVPGLTTRVRESTAWRVKRAVRSEYTKSKDSTVLLPWTSLNTTAPTREIPGR